MPFAERDGGNVSALYARPQPGRAEEFLADDDAEVIAFNTPVVVTPGEKVEDVLTSDPVMVALVGWIAEDKILPEAAIVAQIKAKAK